MQGLSLRPLHAPILPTVKVCRGAKRRVQGNTMQLDLLAPQLGEQFHRTVPAPRLFAGADAGAVGDPDWSWTF